MNSSEDVHATTQELLPWYLNRTLGQAEQRQVEEHIRDCMSCRREMKSLTRLAAALTEPSAEIAATASFAAMRERMGVAAASTGPGDAAKEESRVVPLHRKPFVRFALAASLLLALLPVGMDMLRKDAADAPYYTLAAPAPAETAAADLRVVFVAGTSSDAILSALAAAGGHVAGNPNTAGALDVQLQQDATLEQAITMLRAHKDVLLAEPVSQP